MKHLLCLFLVLSISSIGTAQSQWRKQIKQADELYKKAQYADAADYYQQAYKQKDKKEFLYRAAECLLKHRDYRRAADLFVKTKNDRDQFPYAPFQYALCLKQDGQYEAAEEAFQLFIKRYSGKDKTTMTARVETEIAGCQKALNDQQGSSLTIEKLGDNVNTLEAEFAPIPFDRDILYFSSTRQSKTAIYRSQRKDGRWTEALQPKFPDMPAGQVSNGAFTPDARRFYFTICKENQTWDGPHTPCDIYVTQREGNAWTPPQKLRDYIKMDGNTATQPFVTYVDDTEILYYVTDRKGGKGGLDIWYTTRDIDSEEFDYTLPQNAGAQINTDRDEVTPFYDPRTKTLYFSSNGHINLGGFDIYSSEGHLESWSKPSNMGAPLNSNADDYYFHLLANRDRGYMVSNRLFGLDKISTVQEDIFTFFPQERMAEVKGKILDKEVNKEVIAAEIALYEMLDNGQQRLLKTHLSDNGQYVFELIPNKALKLEVSKTGYLTETFEFNTFDDKQLLQFEQDFYLQQPASATASSTAQPVYEDYTASQKTSPPANSTTTTTSSSSSTYSNKSRPKTQTTRPSNTKNQLPYIQYTPKHSGVYYKIQFASVIQYNPYDPLFKRIQEKGRLDTEYLIGKGWTRVLLAEYFTLQEALTAMEIVRQSGFPDAFLVKYRDGKRLTP